jgi:cysteine sulfinate desulfinase/cysteine desulfurase-like protein
VHGEGRAVRAAIEGARRQVAAFTGADPAHVIFTSGATEAANMVLTPDFRMGRTPMAIGHLYYSAIEHPAVREGGRFSKTDERDRGDLCRDRRSRFVLQSLLALTTSRPACRWSP